MKNSPLLVEYDKDPLVHLFNLIAREENENEYMKSMLPKQISYIPRFALLIHVFNGLGLTEYDFTKVSKESVLNAEKLSNYFIAMSKKVKIDSAEVVEIKKVIKSNDNKTNKEKFLMLYNANPNINKSEVAEQLGISVQMVYKYIKSIKK